ncbi:MAG: hypothetical protein GJ676_02700 [Rhodobacteraceae bacterium]|nr:hypothetical protein [Paracoccaceae bacterium]
MREKIKLRAIEILNARNPVSIDGVQKSSAQQTAEILMVDTTGLQVASDAIDLDVDSAFVGVILSFPHDQLPQTAQVVWEMFSNRFDEVPFTLVDEAGPYLSAASREEPSVVWNNHLLTYQDVRVAPVEMRLSGIWIVPVVSAGLLLASFALGIFSATARGYFRWVTLGLAATCLAAAVFTRDLVTLPIEVQSSKSMNAEVALDILQKLLTQVSIAQMEVTPSARTEAMASLISASSFSDASVELERALAFPVPGGGIARVKDLSDLRIERFERLNEGLGYSVLVTWKSSAHAAHWGHSHQRRIQYRAYFDFRLNGSNWLIDGVTVLEAVPENQDDD